MGVTNLDQLQLTAGTVPAGTKAGAITNAAVAAGSPPTKAEFDAVVGKLNSALAALRAFGIIA